jgi:hypothetical protein
MSLHVLEYQDAPQPVFRERRDEPRYAASNIEVQLESNVFIETVRLVDLGRNGFSVRTMISHPSGSPLVVHLPGVGPKAAQAVWYSRNRLGARFLEPLEIDCLISLT